MALVVASHLGVLDFLRTKKSDDTFCRSRWKRCITTLIELMQMAPTSISDPFPMITMGEKGEVLHHRIHVWYIYPHLVDFLL